MSHMLPQLSYAYNALEPVIDSKTMEIHHTKHHATYVDKLNAALEGSEYSTLPIAELLGKFESLPDEIKPAVRNHGGGHANHSLFWRIMTPGGSSRPSNELEKAISGCCGDFETFLKHLSDKSLTLFGSGWSWLVSDPAGKVSIVTTPNQDSPYLQGLTPILGLDLWEHSYYLQYQNRRQDYIQNWLKLVNWDIVSENYENIIKQ